MCALIDDENGKWIEDRVVGEFSPHKATAILRIPLSSTRAKDKLIWTATPNGCYSTKSAYHLISTEAAKKIPGPSNTIAHKKFWLDIWQLKVPNKIRHFIWRAANRSLPKKKKRIYCKGTSRRMPSVTVATVKQRTQFTQSGDVQRLNQFGGRWSIADFFWLKN